jgi:putative metalloenzyme radical SAM/SPASM domain maturase
MKKYSRTPGPRRLHVEPTLNCNLSCKMCVRNALDEKGGDMTLDIFQRLLVPSLRSITFAGFGEPLLNCVLFDMIKMIRDKLPQNRIALNTNGTKIDENIAGKLARSVDTVAISIDGANPETYNEIRQGSDFNDLIEKIRTLNKFKKGTKMETGFAFTATKKNIEELPRLVELAHKHGMNFIIVSNLLPHTENMKDQILYDANSGDAIMLFNKLKAELHKKNLDPSMYPKCIMESRKDMRIIVKMCEKAISEVVDRGFDLNFSNLMRRDENTLAHAIEIFREAKSKASEYRMRLDLPRIIPRTKRECVFVKDLSVFVSWDGYVRPCNQLMHSYPCYVNGRFKKVSGINFGNVMEQSLIEIWQSKKYADFRAKVKKFEFPPCGDCTFQNGCDYINREQFRYDCYTNEQPCGDCLWGRGIPQCL